MLAQLFRHLNIIVLIGVCYANPLYEFNSFEQEQHYYEYIGHIRCLVCQNESIKDSNAPLASQLRSVIYEQMLAGNDDKTINAFLEARYGAFVNYKPEASGLTSMLWLLPLLLFAGYLIRFFVKN